MDGDIKKIYNELVIGKLVHRFRDESNGFLKIYYHGQKMYDVYQKKIKISNSVLNIPSIYFDKSGNPREREKYLVELETDDPKFELGAIQLVLNKYIQSEKNVHKKFKSFMEDLKKLKDKYYIKDIISGLIKELETKEIELRDYNLFSQKINKTNNDIRFFERVKVDLNYSNEKKKEVLEELKELFQVIDSNIESENHQLFQKPIFYDKAKERFFANNNMTAEGEIQSIVNEYIEKYKSEVYKKKDCYTYQINSFTLGITGKLKKDEFKRENINNINNFKKGLEKYRNCSFYKDTNKELNEIEKYIKTGSKGKLPKISSIKIDKKDELSIEDLLNLESFLQFYTIGKTPFKKTKINKSIEVKSNTIHNIDEFKNLTYAIKNGIDEYNKKLGTLSEKQFQDLLMQEDIASKLSSKLNESESGEINLIPLEEEFVIYNDKGEKGRVDNIYINKSRLIFVEVKMNATVIRHDDHGIAKHLEDMYGWGKRIKNSQNKHDKYIDDMLKGIKIRKEYDSAFTNNVMIVDDNANYDNIMKDYYIICGYENENIKNEILDIMNEEKEKNPILDATKELEINDDGIKLKTKIILVRVLKDNTTYNDIDVNSLELVEYNGEKFVSKKINS